MIFHCIWRFSPSVIPLKTNMLMLTAHLRAGAQDARSGLANDMFISADSSATKEPNKIYQMRRNISNDSMCGSHEATVRIGMWRLIHFVQKEHLD